MIDSSGSRGGDVFDLLLVVDATGSTHPFHDALRSSLPEAIRLATVTGAFSRIGVLAYRDYTEQDVLEWSGWCDLTTICRDDEHSTEKHNGHPRDKRISHDDLVKFSRLLWNRGGKDHAEAVKTALAMAHSVMRDEATTVTFLFADAPPHLARFPTKNQKAEAAALTADSYDGFGGRFAEWTSACRMLAREGGKKAVVHCVVPDEPKMVAQTLGFLSAVTGGVFLEVPGTSEDAVSKATISVLLAWMGVGEGGGRPYMRRRYYENLECLEAITSEEQLVGSKKDSIPEKSEWSLLGQHVTTADLYHIVAPRSTPIPDFASRYAVDETYRNLVTEQLRAIIDIDPASVTLNPVFTTLFRTLCSDLSNPARDELVELFSQTAVQVRYGERRRLKEWLAESYDFSGEVEARIRNVPEKDLFPCVYFDKTQHFTSGEAHEEDARAASDFTREELLEIGRSCQPRVLRRLGKVLSRLSYAEKAEDLPRQIAAAGPDDVPRIPLALAKKEYNQRFFGSVLHAVVPGTVLIRRPAALLAALSLKMGIRYLRDAADAELAAYHSFWYTTRVPETWDLDCLSLLLDADDDYRRRVKEGETQPAHGPSLLLEEDRRIFDMLVGYKMLEKHMRTPLTARVSWTPKNTRMSAGPVAICRRCNHSRSVTMMAEDNVCGACSVGHFLGANTSDPGELETKNGYNIPEKDGEEPTGTWVECRVAACRAQYVVNNPGLRGLPKCFYCRNSRQAPTVQCTKCLNRVVYPEEYRPANTDFSTWECVACESGMETIVEVKTTAKQLVKDNGRDWLLRIKDNALIRSWSGRPLYHFARFIPSLSLVASKVSILPESSTVLTLSGKTVHNTESLKGSLRAIVHRRALVPVRASDHPEALR